MREIRIKGGGREIKMQNERGEEMPELVRGGRRERGRA